MPDGAGSHQGGSLRILIANRSEIAVRIQSSILQLGHVPLGIYTAQEGPHAPHLRHLPPSNRLLIPGQGAKAYLDGNSIIAVAKAAHVEAVIPGYGFLSESPEFAQAVLTAGMNWIGPRPETLSLFGDKYRSKQFARECGVPVLNSTSAQATEAEIRKFAQTLPRGTKVLLKALEGGGGRGIRIVNDLSELGTALEGCKREAMSSFGSDKVFAEPFLEGARHIEVQVVGDGTGNVRDVGERECTLQRRHQKLIELCPSPTLVTLPKLRSAILASAMAIASKGKLLSLSTFEFLVTPQNEQFYFLECNPRLQVEHTVTEEAYGVDLVACQIRLATGANLSSILPPTLTARRAALQLRVNAERLQPDGNATGTTGALQHLVLPTGLGIRVDTAAHAPIGGSNGTYKQGLDFDSLLAKIIVIGNDYPSTVKQATRALEQLRIGGVHTNRGLLLALLQDARVISNRGVSTRFVEQNAAQLYETVQKLEKDWQESEQVEGTQTAPDSSTGQILPPAGAGQSYLRAHLAGRVVSVSLTDGAVVHKDDTIGILESMKMEHTVRAEVTGRVVQVLVKDGDNLQEGDALALVEIDDQAIRDTDTDAAAHAAVDLDSKSPSLQELERVRGELQDNHPIRQKATKRRRDRNYRTAQENLAHLVDYGTFLEFGELALAAQRTRLSPEALAATRNDGVIVGWGKVNGGRTAVVMYDYGVLAGTQGFFHHRKLDRIYQSILDNPAPLIMYAEGGGGRPGDVDLVHQKVAGLNTPSFTLIARMNARGIPIIGVGNGYLFAGNAALLGCSDFIIATDDPGTSIGMGGPAMIEGGGLGVYRPEEVGPTRQSHLKNGNVDIVCKNEEEATNLAKTLVGFFQAPPPRMTPKCYTKDPRLFRHAIPIDRKRAYSMHGILDLLSDDSTPFFEIGPHWGNSIITGFIRVEGQTVGIVASNVLSALGGAVDAASATKASRFINILSKSRAAHILALCDTPGFMVGPQAEPEGGLRAFAEYFARGADFVDKGGRIFGLTVRKAYGLGAQALLGGSTMVPFHSASWPTGEFAGMGIEGAVKLGMSKELAAIPDLDERAKAEQKFIDEMYAKGRAINMAQTTEIDSVIDPAETRDWLERCLESVEPRRGFTGSEHGGRRMSRL